MLIIPAIDLQAGKCVRLKKGDMKTATVFSDDPQATAQRWVAAGAQRLHIVDLDGARTGKPIHANIIQKIVASQPQIAVQVGGGIRNATTAGEYLKSGAQYIIIGTKAVEEPQFVYDLCEKFPTQIIVGLDAKDGRVATCGWEKLSDSSAIDLAKQFAQRGAAAIIYTDISRDGMLSGVNVAATAELAKAISIPVIAAGGVHNLDDIRALAESGAGISGAISGRAIYQGTLDLSAAQKLADEITQANAT